MSRFDIPIGTTWVHCGPFELIRNANYDLARHFGTLRWHRFVYINS
jgi:hypothetical protein